MKFEPTRVFRHLACPHWRVRRLFDHATLQAIERAIAQGEQSHTAQVRFAVEGALPPSYLLRGAPTRQRAVMVFAKLRVWDTEHNNGVLIYVNLPDRSVDIVADRGVSSRVASEHWRAMCAAMERAFAERRWCDGALDGLAALHATLAKVWPRSPGERAPNEVPDRPIVL